MESKLGFKLNFLAEVEKYQVICLSPPRELNCNEDITA